MTDFFHLDYETFSAVPGGIRKAGTYHYAQDPTIELLMAAYTLPGDTQQVYHWDTTVETRMPVLLAQLLEAPDITIKAFNANFERQITQSVLSIEIPPERWRCTMTDAWSLGFKGGLGTVGEQLDLPEELLKSDKDSSLKNLFCSPAPKNHKVSRYDRTNRPEQWQQFCDYNVQDVHAEVAIAERIAQYIMPPQWNQEMWYEDQRINDRGIPLDLEMLAGAIKIKNEAKTQIGERLMALTGITVPGSNPQLQDWLQRKGLKVPNMQGKTIKRLIDGPLPDLGVLDVLELKLELAKTSTAKYDAMEAARIDDRIYGMFQFGAAQRTNRWGGRIVQLQNLPRPSIKNPEDAANIVATGDRQLLELLYG
jgi:DNA polymerase